MSKNEKVDAFHDALWSAVSKVACADCFHPACLAIGDAAQVLERAVIRAETGVVA